MAAAHSNPLSAWTLVRLFAGSARTAMTSGVSRSLTRPLGPSGRKIGSQYAESSFDSLASSCSSRLTDELFTQMKRAGWRFAGEGAHRAASRTSFTSASGTMPGLNARTARRVRMSAPIEPRTSTLTSRLHYHFQRPIDSLVERPQGFGERGELEVVCDQLRGGDTAIGDQRDHLFHRVAVRADPVEIDLLEDDLLEVDRRGLFWDAGKGHPSALADHADRLANRVLGAGGVDRDIRAKTAAELPDPGHRIDVVVIDGLEAEVPRTIEPPATTHDDATRCAERPGAHRRKEAHPTGAHRDKDVTGIDARPLHRVEGDRSRVAERGDIQRHRIGDLEDALDRVDHVGRIRALCVVAVLAVTEILSAVVETQVVPAGAAHPAIAAARVARAGDTRSRDEPVGRGLVARLDTFAGPLVAGAGWIGARPSALEGAPGDLGQFAAEVFQHRDVGLRHVVVDVLEVFHRQRLVDRLSGLGLVLLH